MKKKAPEMTQWQCLQLWKAVQKYWDKNGVDKPIYWSKVYNDSQLEDYGYTKKQVMQRYRNFQKQNITSLKKFRESTKIPKTAAASRDQNVSQRMDSQNPGEAGGRSSPAPSLVREGIRELGENVPRRNMRSASAQSDGKRSMKDALCAVSKVVNGPVMVSVELWTYLGGENVLSYDLFKQLVIDCLRSRHSRVPFSYKSGTVMSTFSAMQILKQRFGDIYDPTKTPQVPPSEGDLHTDENGTESTFATKNQNSGVSETSRMHGPTVFEDVLVVNLEDEDSLNEILFPNNDGDSVASPSGSQVCSQSSLLPEPATPSAPSPKRKRIDFNDSIEDYNEPRRTWKQDPIGPISGVNSMHRLRRLTDFEWMKIIKMDNLCAPLVGKESEGWKELVERVRIPTSRTGEEIMKDFYSDIVPRIRDSFGNFGKKVILELCVVDQYSMSVIFHATEEKTVKGIKFGIEKLLKDKILASNTDDVLNFWKDAFVANLFKEKCDFFNTTEEKLDEFRVAVISSVKI